MKKFNAVLEKLEGKMEWTVFYVPFSVEKEYDTKGRFNIQAIIDGTHFAGTLLPSRNGHYMVFNKSMKAVCKKTIGDSIHVVIKPDVQERVLNIPEYISDVLKKNSVLAKFNELPYYIKREEINKIDESKKEETKIRRLNKLVQRLSKKY